MPEPKQSQKIANACTAEVHAHIIIFAIVVVPIVILALPTFLCSLAVSVLVHLGVELGVVGARFSQMVSDHWVVLCLLWLALLLLIATLTAMRAVDVASAKEARSGTVTKPPRGPQGAALVACVEKLWARFGVLSRRVPHVVWFANFNVLAHASELRGHQEIQVSSGLWERVVRGDPLAEAILTHEIAHLVFRDPMAFRVLSACVAVASRILRLTLSFGIVTVVLFIGHQLIADTENSADMWGVFARSGTVVAISGLILIIVPLGEMTIRRYAGFIASIMELRADVSAALWAEGLDNFARLFAEDPALHRSTLSDLGRSLFSLNLTHIPETERVNILRNTDRLITPKLRYFALSLALLFLFPLNSITPLIAGGAVDHLLMTSGVVVMQAAAISMITLAAGAAVLSWRRSFVVAAALCVSGALPRINLYELGYFLAHEALSISVPQGFGVEEVSLARITNDLRLSISGIGQDFWSAIGSGGIVLSIVIAGFSLRSLAFLVSRQVAKVESVSTLTFLPVAIACLVAIMSSYDPWRDSFFKMWPLSLAEAWFSWTERVKFMRLCSPVLSALAVWSIYYVLAPFVTKRNSR